ncbi:long-chain acyl- synthetase [Fusarium austroafricanum]|uniref:Long-chain acyl- synthetase n=1 Tax=Fusarium austroafricanum TaxID=2364996 RepID=A0A8H4NRU3_9HYPO|nr:long-chain acyl- synthetase [Fusarium austroafricanum]
MALQTQKDYDILYKKLTTVPPPGKPYGVPVAGTERANRTAAYRHWAVGDGPLVDSLEPGINSTHDILNRSARKWPNNRCLGTRHWNQATQQWEDKYDWISYAEFDARRKNFGAGLVEIHKAINYSPEKYGVGLWSQNRAEWQIADFGIASQSLYSVSLYETLGPDTTEYIINHAEVACVVCSLPHIPVLLKLSPRLPGLKLIVSLDPLEQGELASHTKASVLNEIASHHGIQIYSMTQVEEIGAKSGRTPRAPTREDVCTINYTSGTTGNPKGVLITHGNAVSAIAGGRVNGNVSAKDVHLSYLPLAHIYGRLIDQIAVAEGASLGFFRGDILGLVDDMKILKPTGFISVPRLFNRFNSAIRTATIEAEGVRGALSRRVIDTKKSNMRLPPGKASNSHFLYDRIWTPKVKAAVGFDKVHSMVSGSAQLDPDVQEFLRAAFANHFAQGFGMTETYAVGSIQARGDFTTGNIGGPMCCVELCLESVPEFDYTVDDKPNPRGELLLRGPVIFREYYKNAEETEKTLDADGWFHSGDICEIDKMGRFKIIDRKKNVLKLSQGEYISPERIENVYLGSSNLINAAYVHGDGTQSSLVAIFGIDVENFAPFASKILQETIAPNQVADLRNAANNPKVKAKFLKVLDGIGSKHKFNSFEKVRNAHLDIDPFTIDNGLFTPTLKLKRPQAAKAYREHIDRMYEELAANEPVGLLNNPLRLLTHLITASTLTGAMGSFVDHSDVPLAPVPLLNGLPVPCDEPPQKRRRVSEGLSRKRSVKECLLSQISPLVGRAVGHLSGDVYHVNALAIKTVTELSIGKFFRRRWDETGGYLSHQDLGVLEKQAHDVVRALSKSSEFRISPPPSETPEPLPLPLKSKSRPRPRLQVQSTVVDTQATKESEEPDTPIFYDALTSQSPQIPKLPRYVERQPYKPRERRDPKPRNRYYQISKRPYLPAAHRKAIEDGTKNSVNVNKELLSQPTVYHVDFSPEEIAQITEQISSSQNKCIPATRESLMDQIRLRALPMISGRSTRDMNAFVSDLWSGQVASVPRVLSFTAEPVTEETEKRQGQLRRTSRLSSLLMAREMEGNQGFGRTRQYLNFQNEFKTLREDGFQVVAEFTNCAGDITTGAWVSNESFLCGTTTHSDTHNQQYNKPGNLLLCATGKGTLRAFPDHRIPRPRVEKGENSTEAMRQSQDPWLYSSVVASDYSPENDLAYTSSFDKTVKVWKVDPSGEHMEAVATWQHTANVNFVAAAKDTSGRVATAADSPTDAVRIYTVKEGNEASSLYQTFSCSRTDADGSDKWAYHPATMQWGRARGCQHLLLVGYSPRSLTGDDLDIPEDKRNSGEIILWDAEQGLRIPVVTASTANVFEVAWHPTLLRFIVATTPTGMNITGHRIRTQVHVFQLDKERLGGGGYAQFQALDCYASDINELTFVPNSYGHAYVTAACTDGKVYIWDTAQGDKPIHTLRHGKPIEEYYGDREKEDTGVKFTAWNSTLDRFYTGSSDGVIKVWNVRRLHNPFVRDILTAPGPIAWGGFSPDNSKLAIGDATGRCFILSTDERDIPESHFMTLPGTTRRRRRPMPLALHPEPAPPAPTIDDDMLTDDEADIATYTKRTYLDSQYLQLTQNPVIGAVQGPGYPSTNLFRRDAHLNEDPSAPLLADFERLQKDSEAASIGRRRRSVRRLKNSSPPDERLENIHAQNKSKDLDFYKLESKEVEELIRAGALLSIEEDWGFTYEEIMSSDSET